MVLKTPKKEDKNRPDREVHPNSCMCCVQRPCLPRSTYYSKSWRAAGAERSLLLDCFLCSVLLRCGFDILLLVAGWCLCQGCSRTKQHDQLTKATRSQRTEDQRTRRPGTRQPGTRRPRDQGTKRTRRPGDQETQETKSPRDQGTKRTRGPGTAEPLIFFSRNPRFLLSSLLHVLCVIPVTGDAAASCEQHPTRGKQGRAASWTWRLQKACEVLTLSDLEQTLNVTEVHYCSWLEDVAFQRKSAEYLWMLVCSAGAVHKMLFLSTWLLFLLSEIPEIEQAKGTRNPCFDGLSGTWCS